MIDQEGTAPRTYDAWAHGAHMPPMEGHTGTSASGWVVRDAGGLEDLSHEVHTSRSANRRAWEAAIMAVAGVVEFVEVGSTVVVRLRDQALADAINRNFVKRNGRPAAGAEFWTELHAIRDERRVTLRAVVAEQTDSTMALLAEAVAGKARDRLEELGPEAVAASLAPPPRTRGPSFGVVPGGYVAGREVIRRKPRGGRP